MKKIKIKIGDKVKFFNHTFIVVDILTTKRKSNKEVTTKVEVKPEGGGMTYTFDACRITKVEKE